MNAIERSVRAYRVELLLQAAFAANGNFCAAARSVGVHRNTFTRIMRAGGYSATVVKTMLRRHRAIVAAKKPVASASSAGYIDRRIA